MFALSYTEGDPAHRAIFTLEASTMKRFPRLLPCIALSCSMTVTSLMAQTAAPTSAPKPADAPADTAAPATAPGAAAPEAAAPATQPSAPENPTLRADVDDYWHYGKLARYDLAVVYGKRILARSQPPLEVLKAFEATASAGERRDSLDDWMIRFQTVDSAPMKEVSAQLQKVIESGRHELRSNPKFIEENIRALNVSERAYSRHLSNLRDSGELAVPIMIEYLRNPKEADLHRVIARALIDMGRVALNPLLTATDTKDNATELTLITILGNIGYSAPVPYLARISQDPARPGETRQAAANALRKIGASINGAAVNGATTSDLFFRLGEKFYYNTSDIPVDLKGPNSYIWYWSDQQGLNYKSVPATTFGDLMAMRCTRIALELGPGSGDSLALWLAANNKLEVDLPEGTALPVFAKDRPSANYFNVYAGAQYLNVVLNRSLSDHNGAVALKVIKSLGEIIGPSSQGSGGGANVEPLVQAMQYPDRLVRYEAAFALASGQPTKPFPGHERVAPLLAEAVAQTGTGNLLLVAPSQSDLTKMAGELKQFGTAGGENAQQAVANAAMLPWVDVVVMTESLGNDQLERVYQLSSQTPRLQRSGKVIVANTGASPWFQRAVNDPYTVVTSATDASGVQKAIDEARQKAGGLALDEKTATAYALRAAALIQRLAEGRSQVYDLTPTRTQLLASLNDKRPEIIKAVAEALAYINGEQVQPSLLSRGLDEKTPDDVKIPILRSLAMNAKFFGNHLAEEQIGDLQKAVESVQNLEVRTAAAEARGALNLPADQAKALIVKEGTP